MHPFQGRDPLEPRRFNFLWVKWKSPPTTKNLRSSGTAWPKPRKAEHGDGLSKELKSLPWSPFPLSPPGSERGPAPVGSLQREALGQRRAPCPSKSPSVALLNAGSFRYGKSK